MKLSGTELSCMSVSEVAGEGEHFTLPDGRTVSRVGKDHSGRTVDGAEYNEHPQLSARQSL